MNESLRNKTRINDDGDYLLDLERQPVGRNDREITHEQLSMSVKKRMVNADGARTSHSYSLQGV